jgi:hypothetical protein
MEEKLVPQLTGYRARWRKLVLRGDAVLAGLLLIAAIPVSGWLGLRDGWGFTRPEWWQGSSNQLAWSLIVLLFATGLLGWLHFRVRRLAAGHILKSIEKRYVPGLERGRLCNAFIHNTRPLVSLFRRLPVGWNNGSRKRLQRVIGEANRYVQILNDRFTDPSGAPKPEQHAPFTVIPGEKVDPSRESA